CGAAIVVRWRYGSALVAIATLLVVAESWAMPIPLNQTSTQYKQAGLAPLPTTIAQGDAVPQVYRFLAGLPPTTAIIEMPFGETTFETRYMFYSIVHWRRLVNGYSGGSPFEYGLWAERLKDTLDQPEPAWQAVIASRATHLVVHESFYADDKGRLISDWARA